MKPHHRVRLAPVLLTFLISFLSASMGIGQSLDTSESDPILPDNVMEQVVRRVLYSYFKPGDRKRVVLLDSRHVRNSWLPKIRGIEFKLLDSSDPKSYLKYHFEFEFLWFNESAERSKGKYDIGFGYGCPCAGYEGDTWHLTVKNETLVSLRKSKWGYGSSGIDFSDPVKNERQDF